MTVQGFFDARDAALCERFLDNGYVIVPAEDRAALDRIRAAVAAETAQFLGVAAPADPGRFLERIGTQLDVSHLNALRLRVIDRLRAAEWFRPAYFACARTTLETLVGNELAMQRGLGFSIQLPNDASSVLPLHSDVWSEDSPFEVVLWVPLVDCRKTMSMFLLPPRADRTWRTRLHEFKDRGVEALFAAIESEVKLIEIAYGEVLLFTHTLMHGNRVNGESAARWSINIRFKGLFTPYADKQLGDFFDPITLRPASRVGLDFALPPGFDD